MLRQPTPAQFKLATVAVVLGLAVAYLMLTSLQTSAVYYLTVSELKSRPEGASGQQVRVAGRVTAGSIARESGGLALRFQIEDAGGAMPVVYRGGPVPDIFTDHVEVVVEGKREADGTFVAHTLLAKCPSRFEDSTDLPQQA